MTLSEACDRAARKARRSTCNYKVGAAAFDRRGRFLGTSSNYHRFNREGGSMHAEMVLMRKYSRRIGTIIVFRLTKDGMGRIDPCSACASKAKDLDINIQTVS